MAHIIRQSGAGHRTAKGKALLLHWAPALILAVFLLCMGAAAADGSGSYVSDFTRDTDGWSAASGGNGRIWIQDGALRMEGRDTDWNGPIRDFDLVPGTEYRVSVEVTADQNRSHRIRPESLFFGFLQPLQMFGQDKRTVPVPFWQSKS